MHAITGPDWGRVEGKLEINGAPVELVSTNALVPTNGVVPGWFGLTGS
jgi:hypothetical protein